MSRLISIIFNICILSSCVRYSSEIEEVLKRAGDNRRELEKVLEHYGKNPSDSLKYRAAVFLIENMPGLATEHSLRLDIYYETCKQYISKKIDPFHAVDSLNAFLPHDHPDILYDIHSVKSDFLISNIEHSFYVRETQPWGKFIHFDDFCEYILPYRIKNERLDDHWREVYYKRYQPIVNSMLRTGCNDVVEIFKSVNRQLMKDGWYTSSIERAGLPALSPLQALDLRTGVCPQRVELGVYVMRSLGIPVSIDFINQWPARSMSHQWNALLGTDGKRHLFVASDSNPEDQERRKRGKMYRYTFSIQPNTLIPVKRKKEPVPDFFNSHRIVDVTHEYIRDAIDFTVELDAEKIKDKEYVYLGVFNNRDWIPIACSAISKNKATFKAVEKGIACLPVVYREGNYYPAGFPIIIEENGNIRYLKPDPEKRISVKLSRKYAPIGFGSKSHEEMQGGIFQASNDINFEKDVDNIYVIENGKGVCLYNMIDVPDSKRYRYVRYYSAPKSHCNISELAFYGRDNEELTRNVIGTEYLIHENYGRKNAFDKNILTFFYTWYSDDTWIGLDFGEPKTIKKIYFSPRNDDNFISRDCVYELQYITSGGWHSLGRKRFDDPIKYNSPPPTIQFDNTPSNALFRLRNLTKGTEERIFEIDRNGEQIWW